MFIFFVTLYTTNKLLLQTLSRTIILHIYTYLPMRFDRKTYNSLRLFPCQRNLATRGQIQDFLTSSGLTEYASALEETGYDNLKFLQTLTKEQLLEIGNSVVMLAGHSH